MPGPDARRQSALNRRLLGFPPEPRPSFLDTFFEKQALPPTVGDEAAATLLDIFKDDLHDTPSLPVSDRELAMSMMLMACRHKPAKPLVVELPAKPNSPFLSELSLPLELPKQVRQLTLAIDYDYTLDFTGYPGTGPISPVAILVLEQLRADGHDLVLWTCRQDHALNLALDNLRNHGFEFEFVNENTRATRERWGTDPVTGTFFDSRKIFADLYLDDRAACLRNGGIDWIEFYYQVLHEAAKPHA